VPSQSPATQAIAQAFALQGDTNQTKVVARSETARGSRDVLSR